ncbi:MAG: GIY-YIG nuclease family protein [Anaerolineae bacterium]|jgi:Uri superfamily endonuclease|nr:GIY-YIG nuclease family protein [Anaerolineae bacterium]
MAAPDEVLTSAPGTYALGLVTSEAQTLTIGALGPWHFPAGLYIYVGSAWGPGGLAARIGRHLHGGNHLHWHIDYLRTASRPVALWLAPGEHLECAWAALLLKDDAGQVVVPRFGASDCTCAAHLAYLGTASPETIPLPSGQLHYI